MLKSCVIGSPHMCFDSCILQKAHNDTVAKLNFVLALVECIIELAQSRSSPLSESIMEPSSSVDNQSTCSMFSLDHISFLSEGQRHIEQLVLYVRALQLLASSIQLAKEEIKAKRLQTSNSVKTSKLSLRWSLFSLVIQMYSIHCAVFVFYFTCIL